MNEKYTFRCVELVFNSLYKILIGESFCDVIDGNFFKKTFPTRLVEQQPHIYYVQKFVNMKLYMHCMVTATTRAHHTCTKLLFLAHYPCCLLLHHGTAAVGSLCFPIEQLRLSTQLARSFY